MSKSPGHQAQPEHKVEEKPVMQTVQVVVNGERVATSRGVIAVDEDGNPRRLYFPRSDVKMEKFERSTTTSYCPFKGTARYFNLNVGGKTLKDVVWTYEDPYDEHLGLKDRVAFWPEKAREIQILQAT